MRYDEFRDQLQEALYQVRLAARNFSRPLETVDVASTERRWQVYLWQTGQPGAEPFQISARIAFDWSPVDSARAYTTEEDLLIDLVGKKEIPAKTENRWMRVDFVLQAALPYGSTTPLPDPHTLGSWTYAVGEKMDRLFTEVRERKGRIVSISGGREDVKIEVRCNSAGALSLDALSLSAFRIVRLPRVWDDPARRQTEKGIGNQLVHLARIFEQALEEWTRAVGELGRWIRYAPPPPEMDEMECGLGEEGEFEDGDEEGPETIH
ncbi:MAG: hypothetical protein GXX84_20715 [Acidobacteria bacterium]|nr:hypothetical protein [Acidobacteriota bacterium]